VIVHARSAQAALNDPGGAPAVVGDLADPYQTRAVADQVNQLGRVDAVIHKAGGDTGPHILPVDVVARLGADQNGRTWRSR
jgi:NAD(P)-dependent dehydrogenase (short-subunit alcohol dehydrogenase family)